MCEITVIMPCYNRGYDLIRILQAYDNQDFDRTFEVIAVDDASTDETFDVLQAYTPRRYVLRVERQPKNQGPAAARNRGLALASAPLILFVGDDILPSPQFVRGHVEAHLQNPDWRVAILGHVRWADDLPQNTLMKHIDGVGAQQFSYYYLKSGQEYDYRHFYTANISLKRRLVYTENQWFDTNFPYAAFEDAEFAYRLAKHGLRIVYLSHLSAKHYHYHTIWSFSQRQYHCGLMAWRFVRKHPGGARKIIRVRAFLSVLWKSLSFAPFRKRNHTRLLDPLYCEEIALCLASFYEWLPNPFLDVLYMRVLDYFYYKGLFEGIFSALLPTGWNIVYGALVHHLLVQTVTWFVHTALEHRLPLPPGYDRTLLKRLGTG